ncbi:MAG TPA: type II toxin-antitoxin system VapC family toxin [Candidatus Acidoferrum sp.]|nr:type II toxin-antitoxin system VapC family toxin [Candidatus Acidoferrum sp.]
MILLDTHVLVWLAQEPARVSRRASAAVRAAKGGLAISDITMWELALLATRGRLILTGTVEAFVEEICSRVAVLPITPRVATLASQFPPSYPKDPCDRLIGATAVSEGIELVSADDAIRKSGAVKTIW